jgi:hypothetical protein
MHPSPARAVTSALGRHVTDLTRPPAATSLILAATAAMNVAQWRAGAHLRMGPAR